MSKDEMYPNDFAKGDRLRVLGKAGISALPFVGGPSAELFGWLVRSPLERRRVIWLNEIGVRLKTLEQNGLNLQSLQDNEQFVSAAMYASQIAIRSHEKEKREALSNAVVNIALQLTTNEAYQHVFLNFVDLRIPVNVNTDSGRT